MISLHIYVHNVHNHGLVPSVQKLSRIFGSAMDRAKAAPFEKGVMVLGDLNTETQEALDLSTSQFFTERPCPTHAPQFWLKALNDFVEIACDLFNYFNAGANHLNRLARCYLAAPRRTFQHSALDSKRSDRAHNFAENGDTCFSKAMFRQAGAGRRDPSTLNIHCV